MYASTLQSFRGAPREAVVRAGGRRRPRCGATSSPGRERWRSRSRSCPAGATVPGTTPSGCRAHGGCSRSSRTTLFTPDDLVLVKGPPAGAATSSTTCSSRRIPRLGRDRAGLDRVLRHRNALLRQLGGRLDSEAAATLDVWDDRLAQLGERLAGSRAELVQALAPFAAEAFSILAGEAGRFEMRYVRSWDGPLSDALALGTARGSPAGDDDRRPATRRARAFRRWPRRPHAALPGAPAMRGPLAAAREPPSHDGGHRRRAGAAPRRRLLRARRREPPERSSASCLVARRS